MQMISSSDPFGVLALACEDEPLVYFYFHVFDLHLFLCVFQFSFLSVSLYFVVKSSFSLY